MISFTKMHGCGNDFAIIDARVEPIEITRDMTRMLADRHRGIGFDQLVLIETSAIADAKLTFFNADGSKAQACGNATRCCAVLAGQAQSTSTLVFETEGGLLPTSVEAHDRVRVDMPAPHFEWHEIPLARPCDTLHVPVSHEILPEPVAVSMGNPHWVFFVADVDALDPIALGTPLEGHPLLPERGNIGFATVLGEAAIRLRVFERGAGLTLACGSGACAALVAAVRRGLVEDRARVHLDGGDLDISWPGRGPVTMIGPAAHVFDGRLTIATQ